MGIREKLPYYKMERGGEYEEIFENFRTYVLQTAEIEAFATGIYKNSLKRGLNPINELERVIKEYLPSNKEIANAIKLEGNNYNYEEKVSNLIIYKNAIISDFMQKTTEYLKNRFPNFQSNNRIAQTITEENDMHNYLEIGHGKYSPSKSYIWVLLDGKLQIEENTDNPLGITHYDKWGELWHNWHGRYDDKIKTISIKKPTGIAKFKRVPNELVRKLKSKFPEAQEIKVF